MQSKTGAYLGLARRAGKLTLGVQAAATLKKSPYLLVAEETVAANNRKEIEKLRKRFACPLIFVAGLGEMTGKANCKLAAVREEHLAQAILSVNKTD